MGTVIKFKTGQNPPISNLDLVENEVGISISNNRLYQGGQEAPTSIGLEVFSGQETPNNSIGKNGDIYIEIAE